MTDKTAEGKTSNKKAKNKFVDFAEIKKAISITKILQHYGHLENLEQKGDDLKGKCPICKSSKSNPFKADTERNIWFCFVCKTGGNILDLVAKIEKTEIRQSAILISEWFDIDKKTDGKEKPKAEEPSEPKIKFGKNPPLKFAGLKNLDPEHSFFKQNNFSKEIVKYFEAGFFTGKGIMKNRVAIPIHDFDGVLVGYAGQKPIKSRVEYKFAENFRPDFEIYNIHKAKKIEEFKNELFIVKDCFDVWKLHEAGIKNAVALLADYPSPQQIKTLEEVLKEDTKIICVLKNNLLEKERWLDLATKFFIKISV
jgi:DNA primase